MRISGDPTRALAMVSLCLCPPERFLPPCSSQVCRPSGFSRTNSFAWEISRARSISSRVASFLPQRRLSSMVPANSTAFWGTTPIMEQRASLVYAPMGFPFSRIWPSVAS